MHDDQRAGEPTCRSDVPTIEPLLDCSLASLSTLMSCHDKKYVRTQLEYFRAGC